MVSLYEEKNEILDIYANQAIREDVNQVVRIVNRTYRINRNELSMETTFKRK